MNTTNTFRSLGWLLGLILLFSWNVQAESNPPRQSVQFTNSFYGSTPTIDPDPHPPINLTATVGVAFEQALPFVKPIEGLVSISITGLPANGLHFADLGGGPTPGIQGVPLTAGVMSLTLLVNNGFPGMSWRPISLTVNPDPHPPIDPDPHPPINLMATVGVAFEQALPFVKPIEGLVSISITGLPANGLHFADLGGGPTPGIQGVPLTAGVMSLTLLVNNGFPGMSWRPISLTVNPDPHPPIDPDPHPPINLMATVGVAFEQALPFVKPIEGLVSISITGLPANGLHFADLGGGPTPGIQGVPLTAGVMSLTLLVNNGFPGMSWRPISLTVNSGPGSALTLLAPTYNCATGAFHFNTSGGDGSPITFFAIGITGPTTNPDQFVDTELRTVADAQPIHLQATQNGVTANYVWDIRAQCPVGSPPPGGTLTLLAPTYNCTTGAFHFNTSGGNGSPIEFFAIGVTGWTTNPNQFVDTVLRTAADAQPLTLLARQNGVTVSYVWDIRAQCPVTPPPSGSALTLLTPTYNCATGALYFNTSGGDGSPITFFAFGITGPTTNPAQFVDTELRTVNDVQPFLLQATQNGTTVTYVWNLKAACGRARLAVGEPAPGLSILVLGNPVVGEMVPIEVSGAEGQPLRIGVINQQGRLVSEERIGQASARERLSVKLSPSPGVQLLQVSSPSQTKVVRVLKTE